MIFVKQELISSLSFCDAPVQKMELFSEQKILKIFIRHAFIHEIENVPFHGRTDMWLGEGVLVFKDWNDLKILLYNCRGKKPIELSEYEYEELEDIQIFQESEDSVQISSFGKKIGHWTDWIITGSKYHGEFENQLA